MHAPVLLDSVRMRASHYGEQLEGCLKQIGDNSNEQQHGEIVSLLTAAWAAAETVDLAAVMAHHISRVHG